MSVDRCITQTPYFPSIKTERELLSEGQFVDASVFMNLFISNVTARYKGKIEKMLSLWIKISQQFLSDVSFQTCYNISPISNSP